MVRTSWIRTVSLAAAAVIGCAGAVMAEDQAAPAGVMGTASISGKVTFEGTVPPAPKIKMDADPVCLSQHGASVNAPLLVVNNKGVQYAFVFVASGTQGKYAVPTAPAVFDQHGCMYEPHVLGVQAGQGVEIRNSDSTLHNVNAKSAQSSPFNLAMPTQGMKITKQFDKPEIMVPVRCNVHPWMQAYIGVVDHPFFAVSGSDGTFSITGLPAGTYTLQVWHETLGTQTQTVTVTDGQKASANFTFGKQA